jgi:hypothetical protein
METVEWVCEYCGRRFTLPKEEEERFKTMHRELHETFEQMGIKIVWDEKARDYRAFNMETGEEIAASPGASMLV